MKINYHRKITTASLTLSCLAASGLAASAATYLYTGGNLETAANWENQADSSTGVLPGSGDVGIINITDTVGNGVGTSNVIQGFEGATINHTTGTMTGAYNWTSADSTYNLSGDAVINNTTNFNSNGDNGAFNLSGNSMLIFANASSDVIANSTNSSINLSDAATIVVPNNFDLRLSGTGASFTITSDWTGSLIAGTTATETDWINELVYGAEANGTIPGTAPTNFVSVGGVQVTEENFSSIFKVTSDGGTGSSLTLVPEPSSAALLGLGGLALILRRRK